jgi:ribosomal protein S18 acetylase RimI-like enzyme
MSAILESLLAVPIASPLGPLCLRRETPQDEAFRFALFCDSRPELAMLPLDAVMKEALMRQQFLAQSAGYRAQYPQALAMIAEQDGVPIGRVLLDEAPARLHLVDIAMLPALRGKGAGDAILRALQHAARAAARPLRLHVSRANPLAARLYLRLGFKPVAEDAANIEMEWNG